MYFYTKQQRRPSADVPRWSIRKALPEKNRPATGQDNEIFPA
jgi:hypothetical protein